MTQTTRHLRESSVLIMDSHIPEGMTVAEYRRSRVTHETPSLRRRFRLVRVTNGGGATDVVTRRLQVRGAAASR